MRLIGVKKQYAARTVLDGVDLEIRDGEMACVFGKSGAGKTTILNILAGLETFDGQVEEMPSSVGYVFQENRLLPHLTVRENLQYVGGRDAIIDELLAAAGILELAERKAGKLSGGEKRRVAICRAFCADAPCILLDEPFSALDSVTKEDLLALTMRMVKGRGKTAVFVTHDVDEGLAIADKISVLAGGKIVESVDLPKSDEPREYGSMVADREKVLAALRKY